MSKHRFQRGALDQIVDVRCVTAIVFGIHGKRKLGVSMIRCANHDDKENQLQDQSKRHRSFYGTRPLSNDSETALPAERDVFKAFSSRRQSETTNAEIHRSGFDQELPICDRL